MGQSCRNAMSPVRELRYNLSVLRKVSGLHGVLETDKESKAHCFSIEIILALCGLSVVGFLDFRWFLTNSKNQLIGLLQSLGNY